MIHTSARRIVMLAIIPAWTAAASLPAAGQSLDQVREKLEQLNVRHQTKHYRLAGTVSDARFREYGQALEYVHAEYTRGFRSLLKGAKKERSVKKRGSGRAKKGRSKGDDKPSRAGDKKRGREERGARSGRRDPPVEDKKAPGRTSSCRA